MSNQHTFRNGHLVEHREHCDCTVCVEAWEDYFEDKRHTEQLALADIELRQARPATDREWSEFLNREFPRMQGGEPCSS